MELSDVLALPTALGLGLTQAALGAAQGARHARELDVAQCWVDHSAAQAHRSAAQARAAHGDYLALLSELTAARREASVLRAALEESDSENLVLSLEIRRLRRAY